MPARTQPDRTVLAGTQAGGQVSRQNGSGGDEGGRAGFTLLKVFDVLGREVATLVHEELRPGSYEVEWVAANYPSGVYFYNLFTTQYKETKKMLMMK